MAAPKRTRLEREIDLQRIADGYLKGQTQAEIGEALGVHYCHPVSRANRRG
jgi:hypothetical protein